MVPKFHASGLNVLKKKIFEYFSAFLFVLTQPPRLPPSGEDPFWTLGPVFKQTSFRTTRTCYIQNYKQLSLAILENLIFKYTLLAKSGPRGVGLYGTLRSSFEQTW